MSSAVKQSARTLWARRALRAVGALSMANRPDLVRPSVKPVFRVSHRSSCGQNPLHRTCRNRCPLRIAGGSAVFRQSARPADQCPADRGENHSGPDGPEAVCDIPERRAADSSPSPCVKNSGDRQSVDERGAGKRCRTGRNGRGVCLCGGADAARHRRFHRGL